MTCVGLAQCRSWWRTRECSCWPWSAPRDRAGCSPSEESGAASHSVVKYAGVVVASDSTYEYGTGRTHICREMNVAEPLPSALRVGEAVASLGGVGGRCGQWVYWKLLDGPTPTRSQTQTPDVPRHGGGGRKPRRKPPRKKKGCHQATKTTRESGRRTHMASTERVSNPRHETRVTRGDACDARGDVEIEHCGALADFASIGALADPGQAEARRRPCTRVFPRRSRVAPAPVATPRGVCVP